MVLSLDDPLTGLRLAVGAWACGSVGTSVCWRPSGKVQQTGVQITLQGLFILLLTDEPLVLSDCFCFQWYFTTFCGVSPQEFVEHRYLLHSLSGASVSSQCVLCYSAVYEAVGADDNISGEYFYAVASCRSCF